MREIKSKTEVTPQAKAQACVSLLGEVILDRWGRETLVGHMQMCLEQGG